MTELKKPIVFPEVDCTPEPSVLGELEGWQDLYPRVQEIRREEWREWAGRYEADPEDFYTAWMWLQFHPIFWYFGPRRRHESALNHERGVHEGLEFVPAKVDPETRIVSDDDSRKTHLEIWVEVFPASMGDDGRDGRLHDVDCDTGGDTYEEAVIKVAKAIYEHHGNDRVALEKKWKSA